MPLTVYLIIKYWEKQMHTNFKAEKQTVLYDIINN